MNDNPNTGASVTQCNQILSYLKEGHTITAIEALDKFKCLRLASRISDLKKRGHPIRRTMVKDMFSGKWYAEYDLIKG